MSFVFEKMDFKDAKSVFDFPSNFYYDEDVLSYYAEYYQSIDRSFVVLQSNIPIAWFGISEREEAFDFFGFPAVVLLKSQDLSVDLKEACEIYLRDNFSNKPLISNADVSFEALIHNRKSAKIKRLVGVVDLMLPEEKILQNVRGSYRSLINKGRREIQTLITSKDTSFETFQDVKRFHIEVSGRKTRSDKSWDKQFELLLKNKAFLVRGFYHDVLVSCTYVNYSNDEAYYSFGVYNRDLMKEKIPISHWPIVCSIFYAKKIGLKKFILGDVGPAFDTEKESSIAVFKKGFTDQFIENSKIAFEI